MEEAKKMFFDHKGSSYFMHLDNCLDQYKKYGVSKKQEEKWRAEKMTELKNNLNNEINKKNIFDLLSEYYMYSNKESKRKDIDFLMDLYYRRDYDTYLKKKIINCILEIIKDDMTDLEILKKVLLELENLKRQKIVISEDFYEQDGYFLKLKQYGNASNYREKREKELLEEIQRMIDYYTKEYNL